ncbi:MAG: V-type ATPase subunit [Elusimicrobiota bacterium]|nr:V-type ATPase subunit [Elusimicrobiota bacterium]
MIEYKTDYNYTYAVARIHALETKLITKQQISQLLESSDEQGVGSFLKQINYGNLKDTEEPISIDIFINSELKKTFELIYSLIPEYDRYLFSLLISKYDFHNFKVIASRTSFNKTVWFKGRDNGITPLGNIDYKLFEEFLSLRKFESLPEPFDIISAEILSKKPDTIEQLEVIVEKFRWNYLLSATKTDMFLNDLFKTLIDMNNLLVLYQQKFFNTENSDWFIDGGKISKNTLLELVTKPIENIIQYFKLTDYTFFTYQQYSDLEKSIDNYLIEYLSESSKFSFFSIAPIVNFLYLKEFEAQTLQAIWYAKQNIVEKNYIRENLRKIYT